MSKSTSQRVHRIVAALFEVEVGEVTDTSRFTEDLEADRLDAVELAVELEREFGVVLSDDDMKALSTVDDVVRFIESS